MSETPITPTAAGTDFSDALERHRAEIEAIPAADCMPIRLDVARATVTAIGAASEIRAHQGELEAVFGADATALCARVESSARAAGQAHALHLARTDVAGLDPLVAEVVKTRTHLVTEVESLVLRKKLRTSVLDGLRGGQAYLDRVFDTLQLVAVLRDNFAAIAGATPLTTADLDRAEAATSRLAKAMGSQAQAAAASSAEELLRARAFTFFFRTYDEVRRMLGYVRWHHDDVDRIAPSLYAVRTARKSQPRAEGATPAITTGAAPGMPGASPFVAS